MKHKAMNKLLTGFVALALLLGGYASFRPAEKVVERVPFGALAGPDVYSHLNVHGAFTQGGNVNSTSTTAATYTMVNADIQGYGVLEITPNVNSTFTLMASSTITGMIPNPGDVQSFWVQNASSTAAATLTLAAGTGVDLQKNEDTADLAINGLDWAKLTFIRQADTDITVIMSEFIEAD